MKKFYVSQISKMVPIDGQESEVFIAESLYEGKPRISKVFDKLNDAIMYAQQRPKGRYIIERKTPWWLT